MKVKRLSCVSTKTLRLGALEGAKAKFEDTPRDLATPISSGKSKAGCSLSISKPSWRLLFLLRTPWLSGPLQLRVQSRSRTRLKIAASIALLFCACLQRIVRHYSTTSAQLKFLGGLERGGCELLSVCGCEIEQDRVSQSHSRSQRSTTGRGGEVKIV